MATTQNSDFSNLEVTAFSSVSTATTVTSTFALDASQFNPIEYEYRNTADPGSNYSEYYDTIFNLKTEKYQDGNFFNDVWVFTANTVNNSTTSFSVNNTFTTGQVGVCNVKVKVIGIDATGIRGYSADLSGGVRKSTLVTSMTLIGATTNVVNSDFTTASATLSVGSPFIRVTVTGESPFDINWYVRVEKFFDPIFS
jgi:hypothetical protein